MSMHRGARIAMGLLIAALVAVASQYAARVFRLPVGGFLPPSFVVHTAMWVLSLVLIGLLSKGQLDSYGLTRGTFKLGPRIFLWILPTALLSTMSAIASPEASRTFGSQSFTKLQIIVLIWVYASVSEELLTRGLLQSFLQPLRQTAENPPRRLHLSMPVVVSGLFFGAMHAVLVGSMGTGAVPLIVLAVFLGLVAAWYREKTGSLVPAIIVHALFNIGGTVPVWIVQWLRR
jgi:membrane protease YdiL (CAAX protease family)